MRKNPRAHAATIASVLLLAIPLAMGIYKVRTLGFSLADVLPRTQYRLTYDLRMDGHGEPARVRTFLPASDAHQTISEETDLAPGFHFATETVDQNRVATWSSGSVPDGARIQHAVSVVATPLRFELDESLELPNAYPASVHPYLQPEEAIQVDAPDIEATLRRIGADRGPLLSRLRAIHELTSGLRQRPFKGLTDALTALRLGEASCNGRSRLFVALARAAGIPARVVGGIVLEAGSKRTSHQWLEVWIGGHWVPFCPTNDHFAELPENYLALYRGDEALLTHTSDVNFEYAFVTTTALVPSPDARTWLPSINAWGLFERLGLSFALLRTVLLLPIGALVVVLFRNVVGIPTFGTFLPALIAAAAGETGLAWGVVGILLVITAVVVVRWALHRLELLHSPMLAILLAAVTTSMLAVSLIAERLELGRLSHVALFPIAVLAITAERFYLGLTERGLRHAAKELGGTLVVMSACYVVINSLALQVLVIGFPEALLAVVAANIYLGRWVGIRLSEYSRFRRILFAPTEASR